MKERIKSLLFGIAGIAVGIGAVGIIWLLASLYVVVLGG